MATRAKFHRLVSKAALRVLPLNTIGSDPSYQRTVRNAHRKIVSDFDEAALGIPLVAERNDTSLWVVDGLQRITALRKLGRTTVRAEVFHSKGPEHEAHVFKLVNANRTKLGALELFKAMLTARDMTAIVTKQTVEAGGFKLALTGKPHGPSADYLSCVATAYTSVRVSGPAPLAFALRMIRAAWPGDPLGINSRMVEGLTSFFVAKGKTVDEERLLPRLQTVTPHKLLYTASLHVSGQVTGIVEILNKLYKKQMRKP